MPDKNYRKTHFFWQFFDDSADKKSGMTAPKKTKDDILLEVLGGRLVGGTLSQLANYSELFLKMSEGVFLVDRNSLRVLECNPASLELLHLSESDVLGQELPVLLATHPAGNKFLSQALQKFQQGADHKFASEIEFQNQTGDQAFFEVSATTLKILDYIEVIQFIVKDVTEVKRAQRELREMNEALKNLSTTDEMTSLKNYRYFKEVIASVHHEAEKFKHSYGVIFIDVDHFKKYNDRNGHPAGDQVLKSVAKILKEACRSQDLACRYGGEEFVILCRETGFADTLAQAEKVRTLIEGTAFQFGEFQPLGKVSASIGVSTYPEDGNQWSEVVKNADEALYDSKEKGRNRVTPYAILKKKVA